MADDDIIAQQLRDLIYHIEPEETPTVTDRPAWAPSRRQRKKLARLKRRGSRRALKRYRRKLRRAERAYYAARAPHAADRVRIEWLVDMMTKGMETRRDVELQITKRAPPGRPLR